MTALDLSPGKAAVEGQMCDRAKVLRDVQGALDDTMDPNTGLSTAPANDVTTVYEGMCLAGKVNRRERDAEGGQVVYRRVWRVRFPTTVPRLYANDVVEFVASPDARSNPKLVGQRVKIDEVDDRSIVVSRIVYGVDEAGSRQR